MSFFDKAKAAAADLTAQAKKATRPKHTYKLSYFDGRGLGETIRILFAIGEQEYEDYRVKGTWPADKAKYAFGKLPVLEVDGKQICQSRAIERFVAKTFDLYGANEIEQAEIDMYTEQMNDIRLPLFRAMEADNVAKEVDPNHAETHVNKQKYFETKFVEDLAAFESVVSKLGAKDGHFVGGKLSLADVQFYTLLEFALFSKATTAEHVNATLAKNPTLEAIFKKVQSHPKVAEWVAKRPASEF